MKTGLEKCKGCRYWAWSGKHWKCSSCIDFKNFEESNDR